MSGQCDIVKCLLSSGADINLCDKDGYSPLFTASINRHCDVVKCLLSAGADINLCDKLGRSPLSNGDCPQLLRKLISAPELSKHLTTSPFPFSDAAINGEVPCLSHKLISAPELSKHYCL
jgi:hypothetical protein